MYAIKVVVSFNALREGELYMVDREFIDRFGQYIEVLSEPETPAETVAVEQAKVTKGNGKPKKVETDAKVQGEGSDLQGEGEQSRP